MRVSGVKSNTSSSKIPQKYCKNKNLSYLYKLIAPPIPEFHCKITAKICSKIDKVNCADSASFILDPRAHRTQGPTRPTGPTTHWPTKRNGEKRWKVVNNSEKQWETERNSEQQWKMVENVEKRWETVENGEKQWETVKNSEKRWEIVRNGGKRWETVKNGEKQKIPQEEHLVDVRKSLRRSIS